MMSIELRTEVVDVVRSMVCLLVEDRAGVRVHPAWGTTDCVLRILVAEGDLGKVIGKQGRTARSLRTIVAGASRKLGYRFELDIQGIGRPAA